MYVCIHLCVHNVYIYIYTHTRVHLYTAYIVQYRYMACNIIKYNLLSFKNSEETISLHRKEKFPSLYNHTNYLFYTNTSVCVCFRNYSSNFITSYIPLLVCHTVSSQRHCIQVVLALCWIILSM